MALETVPQRPELIASTLLLCHLITLFTLHANFIFVLLISVYSELLMSHGDQVAFSLCLLPSAIN